MTTDPAALLTENQVADLVGLSPRTLQEWRMRGTGPAFIKVGAAVRYSRSALDAWLAARTVAPGKADSGEG